VANQRPQLFRVEYLLTALSLSLLLLAWYGIAASGKVSDVLVPSPYTVLKSFHHILLEGYKGSSLWEHLGISMFRLLGSFALVIITAVPLGLASGYSSKFAAMLDPLVEFYRPLPPLAYYTLLVIWMGIENPSKFALLYLAGFAPVYVACASGVRRIQHELILGAQSLGASKAQTFFHVILPASLPDIFTGLKTALGVAYTTLVAAEMIAAESGVGWMVLDASKFLQSDVVFVGIFVMGTTGVLLTLGITFIENRVVPWRGKY
jgi:taurine transport system permease protein